MLPVPLIVRVPTIMAKQLAPAPDLSTAPLYVTLECGM
jgi:hypothetical protein